MKAKTYVTDLKTGQEQEEYYGYRTAEILSLARNKEDCSRKFELLFHGTGRTLKEVVSILRDNGYSKELIVDAVLANLQDMKW